MFQIPFTVGSNLNHAKPIVERIIKNVSKPFCIIISNEKLPIIAFEIKSLKLFF